MAIEIVDLPSYHIVIVHSCLVCLPDGKLSHVLQGAGICSNIYPINHPVSCVNIVYMKHLGMNHCCKKVRIWRCSS